MKQTTKKYRRGLICVLLLAALIASLLVVELLALTDGPVSITVTKDDQPVTALEMTDSDKIILHAEAENASGMDRHWQILDKHDNTRWIDISDAVGEDLAVTYSLVGSMLNAKGEAVLRCVARDGEMLYASEPVTVTISYSVEQPNPIVLMQEEQSVFMIAPMMAAAAAEESDTYTIVINYIFDNGAIAFEPYGASVAKDSDFYAKINSPTVVGYRPVRRMEEEYVDATVVELDYKNIQQNITINVVYEPDLVNFSVHHHLQNLLDDDYSVHYDLITTSQALTGTLVPEGLALTQAQLPGFKALAYERLPVAADGSTVVEIRYDRNYYLVDFDNNGGYGMEPVYTRYGATVGANTPIRHGYVFGGWELVSYGGATPTTEQISKYELSGGNTILVPDANLRYRARWITQETEYTMVFWKENPNDNSYAYCGYLDGLKAMSGNYVSGEDRLFEVPGVDDAEHFTFNEGKTDKNVLVEGDGSTIVNVYYTRNYYKITFKAEGLCTITENHTHSDACYDIVCDLGHRHSEACNPTLHCTILEHTAHTQECLRCKETEHTHGSADCSCQMQEHEHSVSCWTGIGTEATPSGAPSGREDGYIYLRWSTYYIHIGGKWYRYTKWGASNGDVVDPSCGQQEHTHGQNCACDLGEHTHTDSCYADILHSHSEDCYTYSCGEDLHTHESSCLRLKCAITEGHTHSSSCNRSSAVNTVKVVNRKYQQDISDLWPVTDENGVTYDGGERWDPSSSSYYNDVLVYLSHMPADDFTLTLDEQNYTPYTMNYYLQVLPGESHTHEYGGYQYVLDNTIKAKYNYVTKAEDFFDIAGFQQSASDPVFSGNQISISGSDKTVDFYYNRNLYSLEFNNNGEVLTDKTVNNVMYGAPLAQYYFEPDYPENLEPNAYTFGGWYTSPGCFDGTEVKWDALKMADGGVLLYAKWKPIQHTVKVYKDATLSEQIGSTQLVDHNAFAHSPDGTVENGNYTFQGWFYMDDEDGKPVEKAFTFNGIPIKADMNIYAKWSSHVSVDYVIHYVLKETGQPIADSTYGSAIAGNNKTFEAKAGSDLYEAFRTGYYPLTSSHTITMSVDGNHEFTFEYVYVESMPYVVRYVDATTGNPVFEQKKVMDNSLSVVTETFVKVDKMMPDAYQKRLVLSATGEDADHDDVLDHNVITFYYHSDEVHAYYQVVHYIQNISGDIYREYRSEEMVGLIGSSYTVDALTLNGFAFNGAKTKVNGVETPVTGTSVTQTLGAEGMLIELYYDRQQVNYTVKYVESGTGKPLLDNKIGIGLFGEQVLEYAPDLTGKGYILISENLKILSLSANETHNVIEFIYQEAVVSVKYEVVGPEGCGSLSQYSENVRAISDDPNGSIPSAADGFLFDGWYLDPACTVAVDTAMVDPVTNHITPKKAATEIWSDGQTYYAKFLAKETELTIHVTGTAAVDTEQAFLFRVQGVAGTDSEGVDLTVCIIGNASATITELPVGAYTVTELTDWSWRYENASAQMAVELSYAAKDNVIEYHNSREGVKWLDGNSTVTNLFGSTAG